MKEKKNIILLIFAVIFFVVALTFCIFSFKSNDDIQNSNINNDITSNDNINSNNEIDSNNTINNQLNDEMKNELEKQLENANTIAEDVSNTENIDGVSYKDIKVYKEDNSEFNLSEISNSSAMILFWDPEDESSVDVLKKVGNVYKKYENKVQFLMISISKEIPDDLKNEISMEIYYDLDREYENKYNVTTLPAMVYIYNDNTVMNAKSGVPSTDSLEANLDILSDNI